MKCSVFIATSVDGFIAKTDGSVDWLHSSGNGKTLPDKHADMGFNDYITSVDCMVMGRKCMETISNMNLTPEQWIYGNLKIIVLSNTLKEAPANLKDKVEMYSGDIKTLILNLKNQGYKHAYIDGGTTIQSFINMKMITEMTITKAPILLGEGIPLFGRIVQPLKLENTKAIAFENDFLQMKYTVNYG